MKIPDYLKPENRQILDSDSKKMCELLDEYKKVVGGSLSTEPFQFSDKEWIEILESCISRKITIWNYLGIEYNPDIY